jgi:methionyl-tRNA synthetase
MNEIQKESIKEQVKQSGKISYDDFAKVEIRAGKILSAEKIPDTDKLLKLMVDFAETAEITDELGNKTITPKPRQIVSGISIQFPDPTVLIGKTCMFVANLEPRMLRGIESNGMLFALSTSPTSENPNGTFSLLEPNSSIPVGTKAK